MIVKTELWNRWIVCSTSLCSHHTPDTHHLPALDLVWSTSWRWGARPVWWPSSASVSPYSSTSSGESVTKDILLLIMIIWQIGWEGKQQKGEEGNWGPYKICPSQVILDLKCQVLWSWSSSAPCFRVHAYRLGVEQREMQDKFRQNNARARHQQPVRRPGTQGPSYSDKTK